VGRVALIFVWRPIQQNTPKIVDYAPPECSQARAMSAEAAMKGTAMAAPASKAFSVDAAYGY